MMLSASRSAGVLAAILLVSSCWTFTAAHAECAMRQGPPRYLSDPGMGQQWGYMVGQHVEDQRVYLYDPAFNRRRADVNDFEYTNWRLRKIFEELIGAGDKK
jgi:hypothetical protein